MERRDFIKTATLSVPLAGMFSADLFSMERKKSKGTLEKRSLGKTGERLSIIGFGGIVVMNATTFHIPMMNIIGRHKNADCF